MIVQDVSGDTPGGLAASVKVVLEDAGEAGKLPRDAQGRPIYTIHPYAVANPISGLTYRALVVVGEVP